MHDQHVVEAALHPHGADEGLPVGHRGVDEDQVRVLQLGTSDGQVGWGQRHRVATALNTPFRKVPGQGEDYLVDHSANVVLINPRGDYHGFFKAPLDLAKMKVTYRSARYLWEY